MHTSNIDGGLKVCIHSLVNDINSLRGPVFLEAGTADALIGDLDLVTGCSDANLLTGEWKRGGGGKEPLVGAVASSPVARSLVECCTQMLVILF